MLRVEIEEPQDRGPPVESGRDGLRGEGGRDDAEGEDAGDGEVDAPARAEGRALGEGQRDEGADGQHEGDEQLLAVAQQGRRREAGLAEHAPGVVLWEIGLAIAIPLAMAAALTFLVSSCRLFE